MPTPKNNNGQERLEAYKFLDKKLGSFKRYFRNSSGVIYGLDGSMIASWIYALLKGWGYKIKHFDMTLEDETLKEMDYRSVKKQVDGKKVLLVRDGDLVEKDRILARKIKGLGVNVQDIRLVTTKPYKWYKPNS